MSLIVDLSQYSLVTLNDLPLVYTIGDFNNANITPLLREFKLCPISNKPTRGNSYLDIILTNAPGCYNCLNRQPFGHSDQTWIYKRTLPKQVKVVVRSGKIKDTVHSSF